MLSEYQISLRTKPRKKEKPYTIPKMSAKRKAMQPKYRKMVSKESEKDNSCSVRSQVCTGTMQGMNHKQKRSPKNLMVPENLEKSCNACNNYCETHPAWSKLNGHFISRFAIAHYDHELNVTLINQETIII